MQFETDQKMDLNEFLWTVLNVSDNFVIPDHSYDYFDNQNHSHDSFNNQNHSYDYLENQNHNYNYFDDQNHRLSKNIYVQAAFVIVYLAIFVIGFGGNLMIICSVLRQRSTQTVTNILICNLALAYIILCIFNLPIMPVSLFVVNWPFGSTMCHLTPCIVGAAVFVSKLSLASIAVDRYLVIVHPLKPQIKTIKLIAIISCMWIISVAVSVPDVINHQLIELIDMVTCSEMWPIDLGLIYLAALFLVQFVIPYAIITYCDAALSGKMKIIDKSRADGTEELRRNRRTNRLLIAMAVSFSICWIPLQIGHVIMNITTFTNWQYNCIEYGVLNVIALSFTCSNPLFYKWLNKQFCHQSRMHTECDAAGASPSSNAPVSITYGAHSEANNVESSKYELTTRDETNPEFDYKLNPNPNSSNI